ncbi:hypothetical protein HQ400_02955 [Aeromonas jandaei]|nr:hypothetical protein HQ400_02955 [Aeromonas jandaei]
MKGWWVLLLLWCQLASAGPVLNIYADAYPPFIQVTGEQLSGPYVDVFTRLAKQQGIEINLQAKPMRRLLKIVATEPNSCGLGVHFSAENAETLRYVARIAPSPSQSTPGKKLFRPEQHRGTAQLPDWCHRCG